MPTTQRSSTRFAPTSIPAVFLLGILACAAVGCAAYLAGGTDEAWYDQEAIGREVRPPVYDGMVRTSRHLTVRDGVRIAVDLYLPEGLLPGETIPTILMQTRYVRSMEYRWPFSLFLGGRFDDMIEYFVTRGYAWVYADARGSGASFGTRPYPYAPDEILDGPDIVDWILGQAWSDGQVGSIGSSYTGDSAVFLLATKHPAVKGIMPRYAFFDAFPEVLYPGGVHLTWLSDIWGRLGKALDANTAPEFFGGATRLALKGTRPVDGDDDNTLLAAALADHEGNGDVSRLARGFTYRDDVSTDQGIVVDAISPYTRLDAIRETEAPLYLYTGWYDASYVLSEILFFLNIDHPDKKLTIGPWDHGGWNNVSPFAESGRPRFNHEVEAFRFFDAVLRDTETGVFDEAPVAYYTLGEERWKFASTWPPPGTRTETFYFDEDHRLGTTAPVAEAAADTYEVDFTAGTGTGSRWVSLVNPLHEPIGYPDRREEDGKLLCYTTAPLEAPVEVTGHPLVTLHVSSTADDGAFFVYLEDVAPDGEVTYVTEGMLRALHRRLTDDPPPYRTVTPYRSFLRKDGRPLVPGETAELVFDLYPTSYRFEAGHAIRVALAGADKDHFVFIPDEPPHGPLPPEPGAPVPDRAAGHGRGGALKQDGRVDCDALFRAVRWLRQHTLRLPSTPFRISTWPPDGASASPTNNTCFGLRFR